MSRPYVLVICMVPFLIMAAALPKIRTLPPTAPARRSVAIGPYVDFFWRYGFMALALMAFVSVYRMGDVLALNLSKPMIRDLGYSLTEIGLADSYVALVASIVGVGLGGWMAARWRQGWTLAIGAFFAALGNFGFVWLAHQPVDGAALYIATAADQFGNGMAGAVFVVYLSLLVNPRYPGAQYAFLSGFAFLLPRLLSGAGGSIVEAFDRAGYRGFDLFFILSGRGEPGGAPLPAGRHPRPRPTGGRAGMIERSPNGHSRPRPRLSPPAASPARRSGSCPPTGSARYALPAWPRCCPSRRR